MDPVGKKRDATLLFTPSSLSNLGEQNMDEDFLKINNFRVCKRFNLATYQCELEKHKRKCDGICIKLPGIDGSCISIEESLSTSVE